MSLKESRKTLDKKKEQLAEIADKIDLKRYDARQLAFNFNSDPGFKKQSEEFVKKILQSHKLIPIRSPTWKEFLERLTDGQRNVFAGMFFHHLFLNRVNFPTAWCS